MAKDNLKFERGHLLSLSHKTQSSVTIMGDVIEIVTTQNTTGQNALSMTKRISKSQYMQVDTGEVFDYNVSELKADNTVSIKNSLKKLRKLILNNFIEFESFFVTLTYSEEMTDFDRAVNDYSKFYDNLKYHYRQYRLEYLRIIEPTESGVWHIHVLLKTSLCEERFVIKQEDVQTLWQHGSVNVKQVNDIQGLAAYFCTYHSKKSLANMWKSKSKAKQMRWKYYPRGAKIYTKSRGVVYPESVKVTRGQAEEFLDGYVRVRESSITVSDTVTGNIINRVNYEHYKKE